MDLYSNGGHTLESSGLVWNDLFCPFMSSSHLRSNNRVLSCRLVWIESAIGLGLQLKFQDRSLLARILVTSSQSRPTRRHLREDSRKDVGVSGMSGVQLATRLSDWSVGGLLRCSAAHLSMCRVVLQILRARHTSDTPDFLVTCHQHPREDVTMKSSRGISDQQPPLQTLQRWTISAVSIKFARHNLLREYFRTNSESLAQLHATWLLRDKCCKVMGRALKSVDNCYNIPNFRTTGSVCKTNLHSNTAFRGYGGPQALLAVENVINDVAAFLRISPHKVRY